MENIKIKWVLEDTPTSKKYFAYINDTKEKIGCIVLKGGIVYCYPVVNGEIDWSDNLYFLCLDDFICDFKNISSETMSEIFVNALKVLTKYIEEHEVDYLNDDNFNYDNDLIENDDYEEFNY